MSVFVRDLYEICEGRVERVYQKEIVSHRKQFKVQWYKRPERKQAISSQYETNVSWIQLALACWNMLATFKSSWVKRKFELQIETQYNLFLFSSEIYYIYIYIKYCSKIIYALYHDHPTLEIITCIFSLKTFTHLGSSLFHALLGQRTFTGCRSSLLSFIHPHSQVRSRIARSGCNIAVKFQLIISVMQHPLLDSIEFGCQSNRVHTR